MRLVYATLILFSSVGFALEGHPPPPKDALAACTGKAKDAACSFKTPKGEMLTGKCFTPDPSKPLSCRPENAPKMVPPGH